ncbi:hypothetical protein CONLIGDRAFT_95152 [Coniochaeta ligniaria NRRL 30616]|uniref:Uncharacterized protein n=1 Tax=Coniochaeta ligniaria NRRL 30616 TaxID=1408157 RepID=A0A1J7ICP5_9PEZI|nr:hypothetical protein CONLIGDRAFT_95152 [Coniochaeta ligniaria NRRL 30616]
MMEKMGVVEREDDVMEEVHLKVLEKLEQYAADTALLREELRVEVARKLEDLSGEDRTVLEELRERMRVEVGRDAEKDAPREAKVKETKRKRKERQEIWCEREQQTSYDGEDDSDEEG